MKTSRIAPIADALKELEDRQLVILACLLVVLVATLLPWLTLFGSVSLWSHQKFRLDSPGSQYHSLFPLQSLFGHSSLPIEALCVVAFAGAAIYVILALPMKKPVPRWSYTLTWLCGAVLVIGASCFLHIRSYTGWSTYKLSVGPYVFLAASLLATACAFLQEKQMLTKSSGSGNQPELVPPAS